ncbi:MAG: V-type ATP synthase subunit D [Thermocladium sp.]
MSVLSKPLPSRLTLLKLREQGSLYRNVKRTVEDARNATIQRIRTIIQRLEETRKRAYDYILNVSQLYGLAESKMGPHQLSLLASFVKPTAQASLVSKDFGGIKFTTLELSGLTSPNYGIFSTDSGLDTAMYRLMDGFNIVLEYINLEGLFDMLLARVKEYQRMINAIGNVLLPRINDSIAFIRLALDEEEREDFVRRIIISRLLGGAQQ